MATYRLSSVSNGEMCEGRRSDRRARLMARGATMSAEQASLVGLRSLLLSLA